MARVDPERTVYIYGLHTESDNTVMYVGASVNPKKRCRQHISLARDGCAPKALQSWIGGCIANHDVLTYTVLGTCAANDAAEEESAWIEAMRSNNPGLLNCKRGQPYCCHVDADAEIKHLRIAKSPSAGDKILYMRRTYAGEAKYTPIPSTILRLGHSNALIAWQFDGENRECWIPQVRLYELPAASLGLTDILHYEPDHN